MSAAASPHRAGDQRFHRIAFVYNDRLEGAEQLAKEWAAKVRSTAREAGLVSAWDDQLKACLEGSDLAVTFGGDGTILRVARLTGPLKMPILGVNLGRLGFLTEIQRGEDGQRLFDYLDGRCRVEERQMLGVSLQRPAAGSKAETANFCALNDVTIGRAERTRVVALDIAVDGAALATIRADGVVIATPTGSTAYSLSAGGPIVHPGVQGIVLTPILPHLTFLKSLVIPAEAAVAVQVHTDHSAMCSIDGQIDLRVDDGTRVLVGAAPFPCLFLRAHQASYFYEKLLERLRPHDR